MYCKIIFFFGYWYYSWLKYLFTFQKQSFRKNIKNKINIKTKDKIKDEKLQDNINREAAKMSVLSLGKIDKYDYLTGKEIFPSDQSRIKKQSKFIYSPLGKTNTKNWWLRKKNIEALKPITQI